MMKNILKLAIVCALLFNCTGEDDIFTYNYSFTNESNETFNFEFIDLNNNVLSSGTVGPNENYQCAYSNEVNLAFFGCDINMETIRIVFSNGFGYECNNSINSSFCFQSRNPLIFNPEDFTQTSSNSYEFVITQQDFDNAFDLP